MNQYQAPTIVLLGLKHSGKSSIARALAPFMNALAIDMDESIAQFAIQQWPEDYSDSLAYAQIVRKLYNDRGKTIFQELETQAAEEIDQSNNNKMRIIATGGGIVDNAIAMQTLCKRSICLYLEVPETVLFNRIMRSGLPAFLDPKNPADSFHQIFLHRTALMTQYAQLKITVQDESIEMVVAMTLKALKEYLDGR